LAAEIASCEMSVGRPQGLLDESPLLGSLTGREKLVAQLARRGVPGIEGENDLQAVEGLWKLSGRL
jgi:hypothetical protein